MILYGIPTCDTCRKARKALDAAGKDVEFRDIRKSPLSADEIAQFYAEFGDKLLNKSSTTWRGLDDTAREAAIPQLLAQHPTLMKRPIVVDGDKATLGWAAPAQAIWSIV
ncbi:hypothetical protein BFP70_16040 [Thioclava sp. SK-1]|uniref:arsenate reductase family protein n=1 Tax=Thioclava sp. SK-1 TaxID=1889770 RepID=UPI00082559FB|nr:ArsC/Spx/MgsR family protein [Thioclava sp. SK-1]OCX60976.1 hypothetical protein BFP70_16040 [Thioclava sp. SK-1]